MNFAMIFNKCKFEQFISYSNSVELIIIVSL